MERTSAHSSRALWRRQVVLTGLVAISLGVISLLSTEVNAAYAEAVARRRLRLPEPDTRWLTIGLVVAVVALVALLVAACVHALRIAQLTFRRGDTD